MTITDSISARDVIGFSHFCRFMSASLAALTCLPYKSLPTVLSVSHTVHALSQTDKNLLASTLTLFLLSFWKDPQTWKTCMVPSNHLEIISGLQVKGKILNLTKLHFKNVLYFFFLSVNQISNLIHYAHQFTIRSFLCFVEPWFISLFVLQACRKFTMSSYWQKNYKNEKVEH